MNKAQLRDMRAILASEANSTAFPKLAQRVIDDFVRHKWIENVCHFGSCVYKSSRAGRKAVLSAGCVR